MTFTEEVHRQEQSQSAHLIVGAGLCWLCPMSAHGNQSLFVRSKLKDFFIDRKVPRDQRNMPILFSGSDALFIPGYGISDKVKVDENTKRVLRVTYVAEQ